MKKNIFSIVTLLAILSGCNSDITSTEELFDGGLKGPKVTIDKVKVANGKKVFEQYCIACHQKDGLGKAGFAPRLNSPEFLGLANDDLIKKIILTGRPGTSMMGFAIMPDVNKSINDVIAYMRSWQNHYDTFIDYKIDRTKVLTGDHKKGRKMYVNYCASCHGNKGEGYSSGGAGPGIGLKGFLATVSDEYIKKTMEIGRAGTAMRSFSNEKGLANLTDTDMNDIVYYLRRLQK